MNNYIDQFIEYKKTQNLSIHSIKAYKQDLVTFKQYLMQEEYKISDEISLIEYQKHLIQRYKSSTIKRAQITLKMFYQYLKHQNIVSSDYEIILLSVRKEKKLPRTINLHDISSLLEAAYLSAEKTNFQKKNKIRNIAILELLISTGLRISEISKLTLTDFHTDKSILIKGKGKKERILYISSTDTMKSLKTYLSIRSQYNPQSNHFFLNKYGKQLSIFGIENIFDKYKIISMIDTNTTPHYIRHTFATELLNNGASIRDVQELLGHSSITTTQIYTEVSLQRKEHVLNKYNYRNTMQIKTSK
ncbi:tyrosine-type recombinase/integrase [Pediococcus argentinicus]|uniref:Integrase recombinase n=1 Tax=Pediococcus argentinicus TaxID=480391 RepID=A0A0R2N4G5_9LACO|nr:tyrosine-type recombinase/integrase [Pediococcus argentinicus]KRO20629.1 integrase recombinase [Pediococcus argentinicus]NKZ23175.1 tyrosine-type recombinase/integrase [Pediococcus argentinicus]